MKVFCERSPTWWRGWEGWYTHVPETIAGCWLQQGEVLWHPKFIFGKEGDECASPLKRRLSVKSNFSPGFYLTVDGMPKWANTYIEGEEE